MTATTSGGGGAPAAAAAGGRDVAVVGGGVSGLYAASLLARHGHRVTVFDLGKHAPGGRMTTRRTSWRGLQFDHGAQFLRPVGAAFKAAVAEWLAAGAVARWPDARVARYDARSGAVTPRAELLRRVQEHEQAAAGDDDGANGGGGFLGVLGPGELYVGARGSDSVTRHLAAEVAARPGCAVRNDVRVAKAAFDARARKWALEGAVRAPARSMADIKAQPPVTPWNLGVFDALLLADKMTGCMGTPGFVELSGSPAAAKLAQAMAGVGSTPLLALMLAYTPPDPPLLPAAAPDPTAAAAAAAAEEGADGGDGGDGDAAAAAAAPAVLQLPFDAAAVVGSEEIQWVCVDSAKPGRARADGAQALVALSTPAFAERLIARNADGSLPPQTPELLAAMVPPMFAALQRALEPLLRRQPERAGRLPEPAFAQVHRWGSALPAAPFGSACLTAESALLAACGDCCLGGGVEGAVASAQAAADALAAMLAAAAPGGGGGGSAQQAAAVGAQGGGRAEEDGGAAVAAAANL